MSAQHEYQFSGYTLRPSGYPDLGIAQAWVNADPIHQGKIAASYWTEQGAGVDTYLLLDAEGPVFFFRMERVVRIAEDKDRPIFFFLLEPTVRLMIQFGPAVTATERERNRKALAEGGTWLMAALSTTGIGEVVFDSTSRLLRRFVANTLGFRARPDTLTRNISVVGRRIRLAAFEELDMQYVDKADDAPQSATL